MKTNRQSPSWGEDYSDKVPLEDLSAKSRAGEPEPEPVVFGSLDIYIFMIYFYCRYSEHGIEVLAQQWDQLNQLGMRIRHNLEQQIQVHWGSKIIGMRASSSQFSGNIIVGMFCPINDFAIEKP